MADLGQTFDPAAVPPSDRDFDTLPAGTYAAQIIESELVDTKSGTGRMLKLTWEIIDGPFANRKVWQNLNIQNQSAAAQEIGQRELAEICEATGAGVIRDSEQLHFKPCSIRVGIRPAKDGYDEQNEVKRVKALGGGSAPPVRPAAPAAAPPPQAAAKPAGSRPWNSRPAA